MIYPRGSLIRKARRCIELRFQRCVVTCLWQAWSQVRRMRAVSAHRGENGVVRRPAQRGPRPVT